MQTFRNVRVITAGCLIFGVTACSRQPTKADAERAAAEVKAAARQAGDEMADAWLTTKIQAQYFADEDIKARHINVSTRDRVVSLTGRVDDQNAHDQAVQTARNTDGVREVVDRLSIGPASRSTEAMPEQMNSAWVTTKIQAKYFADSGIKARDLNVATTNGVVTLSGRVDNEQERQRAIEVARNTDGVSRVEDRLTIQPASGAVATTGSATEAGRAAAPPIDDGRITSSIQSKYFLDDNVKGRRINVDSRQGVVTLRGEVGSESERAQALLLARTTEGVQRVEDNLMVVGAPGPTGATAAAGATGAYGAKASASVGSTGAKGPVPDDDALTTTIQSKFYLDSRVRNGAIDVSSKDGVVLLQGTVPDAQAKKQALSIAQDTDGVAQVIDRLKVVAATTTAGRGKGGTGKGTAGTTVPGKRR